MTFVHPLMLWGCLAALIPLLVHLFHRRKPRPLPFAAIAFVLRSQRRTASRLRLRRLLLFLARTMILLFLPLALARPERIRPGVAVASKGPAATAVILDASLSMSFRDGQTLFERGQRLGRDAVRDLLPEEPANFLLCDSQPVPPASPTSDRARVRAAIDEAKPSFESSDLNRCLQLAAQSIESSPAPGKRLVLISDFTASSFHPEVPPPTIQGPRGEEVRPEIVIQDAAAGRSFLPNRAVVDLKIEPALQMGPRAFQFTATIRNFSPEAVNDLAILLRVGDQAVAKGYANLSANGTIQKSFTHRFESGGHYTGEIALSPEDNLSADDHRPFSLEVPKELRTLVVDGSPNTVRYRDEAFFVETALSAPGSPVTQTVRDPEAAFREDFAKYDLILLLNVPAPSSDVADRLRAFVNKGGGLFLSMGDQVDPDAYNQRFGDLLPRPLRLVKTAGDRDAVSEERAAKFGEVSFDHPLLSPFAGASREGLTGARFYRYMLLETGSESGEKAQVVAAYDDGAPAFALARRGQGRVALYTSTVDRDWTDLPIRTSFLPLMQRLTSYLVGSLEEREEIRAKVGDTFSLHVDSGRTPVVVRSPSNRVIPTQTQPDDTVGVGRLPEPGIYRVFDAAGHLAPDLGFAVHLDPAESDLTRLKVSELRRYFGDSAVASVAANQDAPKTPLWTWLIVAACILFFLEGLLLALPQIQSAS